MPKEIRICEDGSKEYLMVCAFCRKKVWVKKPQQKFCNEQHREMYLKRRKSKAKSHAKYTKKHNVERAIQGSFRQISRRLAMLCLPPIDDRLS